VQTEAKNSIHPVGDDETPAFFKTWWRAYTVVLSELALLIILFYIFARSFQ